MSWIVGHGSDRENEYLLVKKDVCSTLLLHPHVATEAQAGSHSLPGPNEPLIYQP